MERDKNLIFWFKELGLDDVSHVGGKNAALGEMITNISKLGIRVPDGFAVSACAYWRFMERAGLKDKLDNLLLKVNTKDSDSLAQCGQSARRLILDSQIPEDVIEAINTAYAKLEEQYGHDVDVAVRSSATAEDLPDASFAGQQETFLNISGAQDVLEAYKKCVASLFTDRAISYRADKNFSHTGVAMSVGIQLMVRSDLASSGVVFTIDTETGFDKVLIINATYGLGETLVGGQVTPDEFIVFKPGIKKGKGSIISKVLGTKDIRVVYGSKGTKSEVVPESDRSKFCLEDKEIQTLSRWSLKIEQYFSNKYGKTQAMDIEWAKDGKSGELYIVQARPETVYSSMGQHVYKEYILKGSGERLVSGSAVGMKIAGGRVRRIKDPKNMASFKKGEVLVTEITDPDWEPIMKIAAAIVTDKGGRTSHAAIVSRELGIPAIVGSGNATLLLRDGDEVTVDCSSGSRGVVYRGLLEHEEIEHRTDNTADIKTDIMLNIGSPDEAFRNHHLPVRGVGLGRLEFIISSQVQIHPNALIKHEELKRSTDKQKQEIVAKIEQITAGYPNKKKFYIEELSKGIAKIGAAFYPHKVIIRFSDFKSNEYRTLLGGYLFEPQEANPMMGWRGASRYYDDKFKEAFSLECRAIEKVRNDIGLDNVVVMVPFCRTVEEADKVVKIMQENGLDRNKDKTLDVYMMCEIPSNVILADSFLDIFDGFSIGSNDLTQLVLGLDRDSAEIAHVGSEQNEAVRKFVGDAIEACKKRGKYVGICGQAPSDFPDFAEFLVERGIDSMSLNPDSVLKTIPLIAKKEKELLTSTSE